MSDLNSINMVGRLTKNAELKIITTTDGTKEKKLLTFSIANNIVKNKENAQENKVSFFPIIYWGANAEKLFPYMKTGQQIAITGRLQQDRWEKDSKKYSSIKIIALRIQLLGKAPKKDESVSQSNEADTVYESSELDTQTFDEVPTDDIEEVAF